MVVCVSLGCIRSNVLTFLTIKFKENVLVGNSREAFRRAKN